MFLGGSQICQSEHRWPRQPNPPRKDWRIWRQVLQEMCHYNSFRLRQPLRHWCTHVNHQAHLHEGRLLVSEEQGFWVISRGNQRLFYKTPMAVTDIHECAMPTKVQKLESPYYATGKKYHGPTKRGKRAAMYIFWHEQGGKNCTGVLEIESFGWWWMVHLQKWHVAVWVIKVEDETDKLLDAASHKELVRPIRTHSQGRLITQTF